MEDVSSIIEKHQRIAEALFDDLELIITEDFSSIIVKHQWMAIEFLMLQIIMENFLFGSLILM